MDLEAESVRPAIDFAFLADAVHALQGKLYVLGGGWDTLFVSEFPARHPSLAIGLRIRVPSSWAGGVLRVGVDLQDEDGARVLPGPELVHEVKIAPPEGPSAGTDIGLVRSFSFNNLVFTKAGANSFVISLDGEVRLRLRFMVRSRG